MGRPEPAGEVSNGRRGGLRALEVVRIGAEVGDGLQELMELHRLLEKRRLASASLSGGGCRILMVSREGLEPST